MPKRALVYAGVCGAIALFLKLGVPVAAHHAFAAEFSADKPLKLAGAVTKVEWINPHTWIHIDVKEPDGKVISWAIEGGPPNSLIRRGIRRENLPVGTQVIVEGFAAKDGSRRANGRDITYPDGRRLFLGATGTGAPDDASRPK